MSDYSNPEEINWMYDDDGRILWEKTSLQPNRTYLDLNRKKEDVKARNIPYRMTAPAWQRHPPFPNYKRLNLYNDGTWLGKHEDNTLANEQEKWHARQAIATQIGLTDLQLQRLHGYGIRKAARIRGLRSEIVYVCLCGIVCYEDGARTHPNHNPRDPWFETVRERVGVTNKEYQRWYGKLCKRLEITLQQRRTPPKAPIAPQWWSFWNQTDSEGATA